ncbi:hypothetical protein AAE115_004248 [Salmonella enterica]|nr:hypothetical protein [Salmonella enterica]
MKKTLIALVVAASAAVSGSAIAWTANGNGGTVDFGGTLTPEVEGNPWEVKIGSAVSGLDINIQQGVDSVTIPAKENISLLGIRTRTNEAFRPQSGIIPQIDYGDSVDLRSGEWGKVVLTLPVLNSDSQKIGTLQTSMQVGGGLSIKGSDNNADGVYSLSAEKWGYAFHGGLPLRQNIGGANNITKYFDGEVNRNFATQGQPETFERFKSTVFNDGGASYSAFYASGIAQQEDIRITLESPVSSNAPITWKASMPITVSYR